MIIKKINIIDFYQYETVIYHISVNYLKEIETFLINNGILDVIYEKSYIINDLLIKIKDKEIFIKLINQITIYNEGLSSSKIENIFLANENDTKTSSENSAKKIFSYIKEVNKININNGLINENILIDFHNNIEKDKVKGIRVETAQYIGNYKAPIGKYVRIALNNFWDIYFGNDEYDDIDQFVRWSFQHLLFEMIHPFDDGNGRSGRMLNFFFFKNQKASLFDDFLFETSSNIFDSREEYGNYLAATRINVKNKIYSSELKKSISRDCIFCKFMLDKLIEKMNWIIDNIKNIETKFIFIQQILINNKILKKYTDKLLYFFASAPIFTRDYFMKQMDIAEATTSKLIKELKK